MIYPTVNLNGTDGNDLLEQLTTALTAVKAARKAVGHTIPHGRDYLAIGGFDQYSRARDEHHTRVHALGTVERELADLAENVADQMILRARMKGGAR